LSIALGAEPTFLVYMRKENCVVRTFIVEDHPVVRRGYIAFLKREPGVVICGEATSASEALELLPQVQPNLLVLDVSLPGTMSGIDLLREMKGDFPQMKVLVVSGNEQAVYADLVVQQGAWGYVMKGNAEAFLRAVRAVVAQIEEEQKA
jgi:DNA-binding NarL/FixJ family response regulator